MSGVEAILSAYGDGGMAPNVALARLLAAAPSEQDARAALRAARAHALPGSANAGRLGAMDVLWRDTPDAYAIVRSVAGLADHTHDGAGPRAWAAVFDRAAAISPAAGVALYCLGREDLLGAATDEIVARLGDWGLTGRKTAALDLGCGCGRMVAALAPRVASVTGIDVSEAMARAARRRCRPHGNARVIVTAGEGLAPFPDGAFDLVLAVDVFPYLVASAGDLAAAHVADAGRVLAPGGSLVILNYSYRGDRRRDENDVRALAERYGFFVVRIAHDDFMLWDGATFHLERRREAA